MTYSSDVRPRTDRLQEVPIEREFTGNQYRKPDALSAWSVLQNEAAIETDLPIVESHHHLWRTHERGRYLLSEFKDDIGRGHDIRASVFIECMSEYRTEGPEALRPVGETEYIVNLTRGKLADDGGAPNIAAAIVGFADLRLGSDVGPVLDAHVTAAEGRFRGIRHAVSADPVIGRHAYRNSPEGLLGDTQFRAGVAELQARNLSFEAWVYHRQLPEVLALAQAFPAMTIVLNHLGGLVRVGAYRDKAAEMFALWQRYMRDLATAPNIVVKLGGLGLLSFGFDLHRQPVPPDSTELQKAWAPLLDTAIDAFGPERCMFESNFPVDMQSCTYVSLWNAFKKHTGAYAPAERTALFSGTAARVYRIDVP